MWIQLIKSEFKKIFKIKMNIVLLIIAIFGTATFVGVKYFEFMRIFENENSIQNEQGENINEIDYLRYIDEKRHQYAGEWSEEKADLILKDYNLLMEKYSTSEIDEDKMVSTYGENYKELLSLIQKNELTHQMYHDYKIKNGIDDSDYEPEFAEELATIEVFRKATPIMKGIQSAYGNPYGYGDYQSDDLKPLIDNLNQLFIQKRVDIDKNYLMEHGILHDELIKKDIDLLIKYLNNEVLSAPIHYDSTVSNHILISALDNALWIPLICIMIILANTFGIEKQYHVDQIIHPTKAGLLKITVSKIIMGTLLSTIVMLLAIGLSYLVGMLLVPIHTWNVACLNFRSIVPNPIIMFNYKDVLLNTILLSLFASLAISSITLGLSYLIKNKFAVIIILFIFIASGIFLNISRFYQFIHPYTMTHINLYQSLYNLPLTVLNGQMIPYTIIAIIFWALTTFVIYLIIIVHTRIRSARNV